MDDLFPLEPFSEAKFWENIEKTVSKYKRLGLGAMLKDLDAGSVEDDPWNWYPDGEIRPKKADASSLDGKKHLNWSIESALWSPHTVNTLKTQSLWRERANEMARRHENVANYVKNHPLLVVSKEEVLKKLNGE